MSFFGGDHTKGHFVPALPYRLTPDEKRSEGEARRKAERVIATEAGFGDFEKKYFQYTEGDEKGKAAAKVACERYAQAMRDATGLTINVVEGCFL